MCAKCRITTYAALCASLQTPLHCQSRLCRMSKTMVWTMMTFTQRRTDTTRKVHSYSRIVHIRRWRWQLTNRRRMRKTMHQHAIA